MPVVPNGGFQSGLLPPWTANPPGSASVTPLFPNIGSFAAQMTASTVASTVTLTSAPIPVAAGTEYLVRFAALWDVVYRQAQTLSLIGAWSDQPAPILGSFTLPVIANWATDQYTLYETQVNAPEGSTTLTLSFQLEAGNQPVSLLLDSVMVLQVLSPT